MKKCLAMLGALAFVCSVASAEIVTVTGRSEYTMRGSETLDAAKQSALNLARKGAMDEAKKQIKGHTALAQYQQSATILDLVASKLLSVKQEEVTPKVENKGYTFASTVTGSFNTDDIATVVSQTIKERNGNLEQAYKDIQAENAKLKEQLKFQAQEQVTATDGPAVKAVTQPIATNIATSGAVLPVESNPTVNPKERLIPKPKVKQAEANFMAQLEGQPVANTGATTTGAEPTEAELIEMGDYAKFEGKYQEAGVIYTKCINSYPNSLQAYIGRGACYRNLQRYNEALADYTKALELKSDDYAIYHDRAVTYHLLHRYNEAIADYTKALELKRDYLDAYTNRAAAYFNSNRHKEALADCDKAISINPKFALAYYTRAQIYYNVGLKTKAAQDAQTALALNPQMQGAKELLAKIK